MSEETKPPVKRKGSELLKGEMKGNKAELTEKMRKLKYVYDLPKIDINSDQEVEDRINLYFNYSLQEGLRPNIEGLALAIGVSRSTLWDWETGRRRDLADSTRADIVKKAKDYIAYMLSDGVMDGKINPVTWIFYAKNYFGMKDTQDINLIPTTSTTDTVPLDDIKKLLQDQHDKSNVIDVDGKEI